ncbi:ABC transporter permease [Mastigocoleus sp. MO_188.B34]|uniref:ABC transporter permease n=1 Tax=Mastigocoleus sp. MO_188.B34 TaxID=3036635 RepID=UPI00261E1135|nr:ABC transporter permease [Mastigocoleus sp. MO_188.B34]MDJ0697127.1 ABC transporter permease [Mastigocoleus sp. MO_188.B34]
MIHNKTPVIRSLKRFFNSFIQLYCQVILPPFATLLRHRLMLYQTTINEIKTRYAGSVLGLLWLVVYPLLFLGTYAVVYLYIFKIRFPDLSSNEYVALIFCGLIPFLGFSEALSAGVPCVVSSSNLIKNTLFPIELVPVKAVFVGQATQFVGMILLLIALTLIGKLSILSPIFLLVWACQILFSIGLVWILSSLNVYIRDIQNIIAIVILILMMLSPIAYTEAMVPESMRPFLAMNPLYYMIISYQSVLMLNQFPFRTFVPLIVMSFGIYIIGFWFFTRMKKIFSDNI